MVSLGVVDLGSEDTDVPWTGDMDTLASLAKIYKVT